MSQLYLLTFWDSSYAASLTEYTQTEIAMVDKRLYFTGDLEVFSAFANRRVNHVVCHLSFLT